MLNYTEAQRANLLIVKEVVAEAIKEDHLNYILSEVNEVLADINDHSAPVNQSIDRMIDERQCVSIIVS